MPRSVVGFTIGKLLILGLDLKVFSLLFLSSLGAILLAGFLQWEILSSLYLSLDDLRDNTAFCQTGGDIGSTLRVCAIGAFLLNISDAYTTVFLELNIIFTSCRFKRAVQEQELINTRGKTENPFWIREDLVAIQCLHTDIAARATCFALTLFELIIWGYVFVVGIKYMLTAETVSDLVLSAVAVNFLNEVNNRVYETVMPALTRTQVDDELFEVPLIGADSHASTMLQLFSLFGTLPALIVVTVGIVFGLHNTYC